LDHCRQAPRRQDTFQLFFNYAEALLNQQGIYGEAQYSKSFFTLDRARTLYSVESWDMSPHTQDLINRPKQTFHVYSLLQCLKGLTTHPPVLPVQGISLLQAKNLGSTTALLFRMIDMRPDFLSSSFDRSILGRRRAQWSQLPDNTAVHQIWQTHQRLVSYLWFSTLRDALHIMQCWIKAQRFHHSQGFLSATEATSGAPRLLVTNTFPSHIPGQNTNLVEAFARYDMQFTAQWYDLTRHPHDASWQSQPPPDHFLHAAPVPAPPVTLEKRTGREREQPSKRLKPTTAAAAGFVSQAPLFEPIVPFPQDKPAITTLLAPLPAGTRFPQMGETDGKSQYICFHSAFPSPHNKCTTSKCKNRKQSLSAATRLHVDPITDPWKSKEEDFWKPIVEFLQNPEVARHFRPSATFISLTPSTSWT
jgi:hypothetical protein